MMKKLIGISLMFVAFSAFIVYQTTKTTYIPADDSPEAAKIVSGCTNTPSRKELLLTSQLKEIRTLAEIDSVCNSLSVSDLSIRTYIPIDSLSAKNLPISLANTLIEFHKFGINPRVHFTLNQNLSKTQLDTLIKTGNKDILTTYFSTLQSLGIDETNIGTWIPYPEPNLPHWANTNIAGSDFSKLITSFDEVFSKSFPNTKYELLFSSSTYDTPTFSWSQGEYVPLDSYLQNLTAEHISSIGISGYPWLPKASQKRPESTLDAQEYITETILDRAYQITGVTSFTIYTGTFASKYTGDSEDAVIVPADIRYEIIDKTLAVLRKYKSKNYSVSVVLKVGNHSADAEQTDWSYWGSDWTQNQAHKKAFINLMQNLHSLQIHTGIIL